MEGCFISLFCFRMNIEGKLEIKTLRCDNVVKSLFAEEIKAASERKVVDEKIKQFGGCRVERNPRCCIRSSGGNWNGTYLGIFKKISKK